LDAKPLRFAKFCGHSNRASAPEGASNNREARVVGVNHDQANKTENTSKGKSSGKANRANRANGANGANAGANYDSDRLKDCPRSGKPLKTNKPGNHIAGRSQLRDFFAQFQFT